MFLCSVDRLITIVPEKTCNVPPRDRTEQTDDGKKDMRQMELYSGRITSN